MEQDAGPIDDGPPAGSRSLRAARLVGRLLGGLVLLVAGLWTAGAVWWAPLPVPVRRVLAVAVTAATVAAWALPRVPRRLALGVSAAALVLGLALQAAKRPSAERDWAPDLATASTAESSGDVVTLRNVRNCRYRSEQDFDVRHYDLSVRMSDLEGAYFVVEPLTASRRVAHTFVSFRFAGGVFVAISVEIRRERGESYGVLPGLFREFELVYVAADERDVVGLRVLHRGNPVHVYPVDASRERIGAMFRSMLRRMNALVERPEFYDTLTSTCTTNLVDHVNELVPGAVGWDTRILFPGRADELARELGLIDSALPIEEVRERHRVDPERARAAADDPRFPLLIR